MKVVFFCAVALVFVWKQVAMDETYRIKDKLDKRTTELRARLIELQVIWDRETSFPTILEKAKAYGFHPPIKRPIIINLTLDELPSEFFRGYKPTGEAESAE